MSPGSRLLQELGLRRRGLRPEIVVWIFAPSTKCNHPARYRYVPKTGKTGYCLLCRAEKRRLTNERK